MHAIFQGLHSCLFKTHQLMALNPNMPVTIRSVIVGDAPDAGPEWLILTQPAADCHFV